MEILKTLQLLHYYCTAITCGFMKMRNDVSWHSVTWQWFDQFDVLL